jgi:hypothetical protein
VLEALNSASQDPTLSHLRAAALESVGQLCPQGAQVAFRRGAEDPDPFVRATAAKASARCKK